MATNLNNQTPTNTPKNEEVLSSTSSPEVLETAKTISETEESMEELKKEMALTRGNRNKLEVFKEHIDTEFNEIHKESTQEMKEILARNSYLWEHIKEAIENKDEERLTKLIEQLYAQVDKKHGTEKKAYALGEKTMEGITKWGQDLGNDITNGMERAEKEPWTMGTKGVIAGGLGYWVGKNAENKPAGAAAAATTALILLNLKRAGEAFQGAEGLAWDGIDYLGNLAYSEEERERRKKMSHLERNISISGVCKGAVFVWVNMVAAMTIVKAYRHKFPEKAKPNEEVISIKEKKKFEKMVKDKNFKKIFEAQGTLDPLLAAKLAKQGKRDKGWLVNNGIVSPYQISALKRAAKSQRAGLWEEETKKKLWEDIVNDDKNGMRDKIWKIAENEDAGKADKLYFKLKEGGVKKLREDLDGIKPDTTGKGRIKSALAIANDNRRGKRKKLSESYTFTYKKNGTNEKIEVEEIQRSRITAKIKGKPINFTGKEKLANGNSDRVTYSVYEKKGVFYLSQRTGTTVVGRPKTVKLKNIEATT